MKKIGDLVTVRCAPPDGEPETFLRGTIAQTYARSNDGRHALHIVEPSLFKWGRTEAWQTYDGVQFVLTRETNGTDEFEWVDTWPRRG